MTTFGTICESKLGQSTIESPLGESRWCPGMIVTPPEPGKLFANVVVATASDYVEGQANEFGDFSDRFFLPDAALVANSNWHNDVAQYQDDLGYLNAIVGGASVFNIVLFFHEVFSQAFGGTDRTSVPHAFGSGSTLPQVANVHFVYYGSRSLTFDTPRSMPTVPSLSNVIASVIGGPETLIPFASQVDRSLPEVFYWSGLDQVAVDLFNYQGVTLDWQSANNNPQNLPLFGGSEVFPRYLSRFANQMRRQANFWQRLSTVNP